MAGFKKVCRICLKNIEGNEQYFNISEFDILILQAKMLDFISEYDFHLTPESIACYHCMSIIGIINNFKKVCVQTEKNWRKQQQVAPFSKGIEEVVAKEEVTDLPLFSENADLVPNSHISSSTDKEKFNQYQFLYDYYLIRRNAQIVLSSADHPKDDNYNDYTSRNPCEFKNSECYNCHVCNKVCSNPATLEQHLSKHTGKLHYDKCAGCLFGNSCKYKINLTAYDNLFYSRLREPFPDDYD